MSTIGSILLVGLVAGVAPGCVTQRPSAAALEFVPAQGSPFAAGPRPSRPAVADFNLDGKPDIALTCGTRERPEEERILILLNDGAGRFAPAEGGFPADVRVDKVTVADFNSDGKPDVAGVHHDSYNVHVFLGDGRGGLRPAAGSPFAAHTGQRPHTHDVACADVNADGHADILTTNADDDAISVLLGDGRGGFARAAGSPFAAARHPYAGIAIRDVSGDGKPDVVAPLVASGAIGVYLGDGTGKFSPAPGSPYRVAERPGYAYVDDLNGDGRPDILATHDNVGMLDVLLNTGDGRFRPAPGSPVRVGRPAWTIVTADFDRDGNTDVLLSSQGRGALTLLMGDGRGGLSEARVDLPTGDEPGSVAAADLNGDGKPDIITSNYASGDVTVLLVR